MTPEQLQRFEEMETKINKLYDVYFSNDFPDRHVFNKKLVVDDYIVAKGIILKGKVTPNGSGIEIRTGFGYTNATIVAEIGAVPDGSLYLSLFTLQWPLFVKYNGAWIQVTLP